MAKKILPSAKQKRIFFIHLVIFAVANAGLWWYRSAQMADLRRWVYPTAAWITAAWALAVIGHWCALWTSYEDTAMDEYKRQTRNG